MGTLVETPKRPEAVERERRNAVAIVAELMRLRGHAVDARLGECLSDNADAVRSELIRRYGYVSDQPLYFARSQVAAESHPAGW